MQEIKFFEIRDSMTFIPVMAVGITVQPGDEHYLLRRAGFPQGEFYVCMTRLVGHETCWDPYSWRSVRPMEFVHIYIIEHWDTLKSGDVIDWEFLNGRTDKPKESERIK